METNQKYRFHNGSIIPEETYAKLREGERVRTRGYALRTPPVEEVVKAFARSFKPGDVIYVGDVYGKRARKFIYDRDMNPVEVLT